MPIQGTSADIMKLAMINISKSLSGLKSKLIVQVHDEVLVDVHPDEISKVSISFLFIIIVRYLDITLIPIVT